MAELLAACDDAIVDRVELSAENCIELYTMARDYGLPNLEKTSYTTLIESLSSTSLGRPGLNIHSLTPLSKLDILRILSDDNLALGSEAGRFPCTSQKSPSGG